MKIVLEYSFTQMYFKLGIFKLSGIVALLKENTLIMMVLVLILFQKTFHIFFRPDQHSVGKLTCRVPDQTAGLFPCTDTGPDGRCILAVVVFFFFNFLLFIPEHFHTS